MLENTKITKDVRLHGERIVEVNPTYSIIEKSGMTEEILSLYEGLSELNCVLQFVRSGRIAITKGCVEKLTEYLTEREAKYNQCKQQQQQD